MLETGKFAFDTSNSAGKVSRSELEKYTKKSRGTVINRLNNLMEKGVVKVNGDIHDPTRTYELA